MKFDADLFQRWGVPIILLLVWGSWFFVWGAPALRHRPVAMITCSFASIEDQGPIRLGQYLAPLEQLVIEGDLRHGTNTLYSFEGDARYVIEDRTLKASVSGSVSLDAELQPQAVIVTVRDADFGRNGLNVYTANEAGMLDYSDERAYAYTDKDFRLAHPMTMDCATRIPQTSGFFGWLRS